MTDKSWIRLMRYGEKLGCHQMPERSFFYKGYQFPVCARCTGVIISSFFALFVFIRKRIPTYICLLLSGVMFIDWFIQRIGILKSTNIRRLITGLLGGFGFITLQLKAYMFLFTQIFHRKSED